MEEKRFKSFNNPIKADNKVDEYEKLKRKIYIDAVEEEKHAMKVESIQRNIYEDWNNRHLHGFENIIDENLYNLNLFQIKNRDMFELLEVAIENAVNDILLGEENNINQYEEVNEHQEKENG